MQLFRKFIYEALKHHILYEAKIDDAKKKFPDLDPRLIDDLNDADPSPTKKYLMWMVAQVDAGFTLADIIPSIEYFHQNPNKFKKRDINAYRDADELEDAVKDISSKVSSTQQRKQIKISDAQKIYEDEIVTVVRIDSKQAAMAYGAGTKWCITMSGQTYYEQYTQSNVIFHFILQKHPIDDPFDKVAVATQRDKNNKEIKVEYFDATDRSLSENNVLKYFHNDEIFLKIEADAAAQPKAFLARLKSGDAVTDEEIKQYWMGLNSLSGSEKHIAQWTLFDNIPKKQRASMMSYVNDAALHDVIEGVAVYDGSRGGAVYRDKHGQISRDNGPAIIKKDGTTEWYRHGALHREDGPAIEEADGTKLWFQNNRIHREDGPAIIGGDGELQWKIRGRLHREDGPALIYPDGAEYYWLYGKYYDDEQAWEAALKEFGLSA